MTMFSLSSTVLLSMANVAHAHFGRFQPRMAAQECCPCPGFNNNDEAVTTVTVTEAVPAPQPVTIYVPHLNRTTTPGARTVTIHRTITEAPLTVYVTLDDFAAPPRSERIEEFIVPEPSAVTVYVGGSPAPQAPGSKDDGTASNDSAVEAEKNNHNKFVVLDTVEPAVPAQTSAETKTVTLAPAKEVVAAISSGLAPATTTTSDIVYGIGIPGVAVEEAVAPPVTASPSFETEENYEAVDHYQTITQSVHNGDSIDIQITIINIDTGDETCTIQDTGLPCIDGPRSNTTVPVSLNATSGAPGSVLPRHQRSHRHRLF